MATHRFKIVGEKDGIPIKRYGHSVRGPAQTPKSKNIRALKQLPPALRNEISNNRFQRLSLHIRDAVRHKRAVQKAREKYEELKAQRLAVLGPGEYGKRIGEAQTPTGSGDTTTPNGARPRGASD